MAVRLAASAPAVLMKLALSVLLAAVWWWSSRRTGGTFIAIASTVGAVVGWKVIDRWQGRGHERFIAAAPLPSHLRQQVLARYPHLQRAQLDDIERGLRQFFQCHLRAKQFVSMPSNAVDALWHAFILDTRAYQRFCQAAFGGFLHHSPAETLGRDARRNNGLRRTWYHACRIEGIDPRRPKALPLLFALDAALALPDALVYVPDCRAVEHAGGGGDAGTYCGTSFSDGSSAGDGSGSFGGEAGHGGGHGHGDGHGSSDGGDGGGGDGGGCGGGGD